MPNRIRSILEILSDQVQVACDDDINILSLIKGAEQYTVFYTNHDRANALRVLGRWASNPELSFTWYDAAVLAEKSRHAY